MEKAQADEHMKRRQNLTVAKKQFLPISERLICQINIETKMCKCPEMKEKRKQKEMSLLYKTASPFDTH